MSVRPVWRKKLNYCNTSNKVDVNLPTPMPKPQSPLKEPSQENLPTTHSNHHSLQSHLLPLGDTNVEQALIPPQCENQTQLTQPSFPHLLINSRVASVLHAKTPSSPQGVNSSTEASGSKPRSNTKNNRILPARSDNKKKVEDNPSNSRTYRLVVFGLRLLKTYDGESLTAQEFHKKCDLQDGVELLKGNRGSNMYTISVEDMMKSSPICLLSKASKNKSWLWHRHLNRLNFGTINDLARKDLVRGLPRLKFEKDHLCSACQLGKSKKSKDDTPEFVIKFLEQIQVVLNKTNGVVEIRNRTLVEAARTMLIFSKALMFLWAEAVATACYTQKKSLIHIRHNKTSYELVHGKKPDLTFLRIFGALCYPTNDSENLGKLKAKADIGIFIGYAPNRKGYRIYNKRTRQIMEIIHVQFDELTEHMAPMHISSGPEPI
ncbi:integrase, catalytic region, zinc finger, CCHC-type containing protein [Tanacetum coccineum]